MSPRRTPSKTRSTRSATAQGWRARAALGAPHVVHTGQGFESRMIDVQSKPVTARSATARAVVHFPGRILARVLSAGGPKGPITEVARAAGILAAKRTGDLIPMCHPLGLDHVEIRFEALDAHALEVRCTAACSGRTGVEMEALVGASIAALAVYDMTKGLDHTIAIRDVELLEKRGGKSGHFVRAHVGPRANSNSAPRKKGPRKARGKTSRKARGKTAP